MKRYEMQIQISESKDKKMITDPDNDNNSEGPMVFIIIGKGYRVR